MQNKSLKTIESINLEKKKKKDIYICSNLYQVMWCDCKVQSYSIIVKKKKILIRVFRIFQGVGGNFFS